MTDLDRLDQLTALLDALAVHARARPDSQVQKGLQDHVTDVDLRLDALLLQRLPAILDAPVLSEERVRDAPDALTGYWMVDPLDGTANLIAGLPICAISVAYIDADGPRIAAVTSADGQSWGAVRGAGAWVNGKATKLPPAPASELIVLSTGLLDILVRDHLDSYAALRKTGKIRNLGSQAQHLCGVGSGRFAAVLSVEARIWDEAAGGLIAREAGGVWQAASDGADWTNPAAMMDVRQYSLACHPALRDTLKFALHAVPGFGAAH